MTFHFVIDTQVCTLLTFVVRTLNVDYTSERSISSTSVKG